MPEVVEGVLRGLLSAGIAAALIGVPMIAWRIMLGPWRCPNCSARIEARPADRRAGESTKRATMRTHTKWCVS